MVRLMDVPRDEREENLAYHAIVLKVSLKLRKLKDRPQSLFDIPIPSNIAYETT